MSLCGCKPDCGCEEQELFPPLKALSGATQPLVPPPPSGGSTNGVRSTNGVTDFRKADMLNAKHIPHGISWGHTTFLDNQQRI